MVIIEHLGRHTYVIPTLARWTDEQWGHLLPNTTRADMERRYKLKAASHTIPQTFVAMDDKKPVGMASLIEYDMDDRHDLTPWLASVYVEPEYRRQGLGGKLVQTIMAEAQRLDIKRLYLFTPDQMPFYRRLGWKDFEECDYRGEHVTIMVYEWMND